jgi:hypothetical protein
VNNFSIRLKLVFVAAAALVLAAMLPLFSPTALAQPARGHGSELSLAVHERPSGMFERRAATMPDGIGQDRRLSPGPVIGLICAIVASSLALGIAFGLRRQIDRIAGPDPEKEDDD